MNEEKKLKIKNNVTGEWEEVVPIKPWTPNEMPEREKVTLEQKQEESDE